MDRPLADRRRRARQDRAPSPHPERREHPFWRSSASACTSTNAVTSPLAHAGPARQSHAHIQAKGLPRQKARPADGFEDERGPEAELEEIKRRSRRRAPRARGGVDGVEINGATATYSAVLSRRAKRERDAYGGPLENRARCCRHVKASGPGRARLSRRGGLDDSHAKPPTWVGGGTRARRWRSAAGSKRPARTRQRLRRAALSPIPRTAGGVALDTGHSYEICSRRRRTSQHLSSGLSGETFHAEARERDPRQCGPRLPDARREEGGRDPVIVTGGFQQESLIAGAIERGDCDAVRSRASRRPKDLSSFSGRARRPKP